MPGSFVETKRSWIHVPWLSQIKRSGRRTGFQSIDQQSSLLLSSFLYNRSSICLQPISSSFFFLLNHFYTMYKLIHHDSPDRNSLAFQPHICQVSSYIHTVLRIYEHKDCLLISHTWSKHTSLANKEYKKLGFIKQTFLWFSHSSPAGTKQLKTHYLHQHCKRPLSRIFNDEFCCTTWQTAAILPCIYYHYPLIRQLGVTEILTCKFQFQGWDLLSPAAVLDSPSGNLWLTWSGTAFLLLEHQLSAKKKYWFLVLNKL